MATTTNALDRPATYLFTADQSSDWYRIYVGHAWLRLAAGLTAPVEVAYESLAGDPVVGQDFEDQSEMILSTDDHVAVTSWLLPEDTECDTPREWWGVGLDLRAGQRTWIDDVRLDGELVTGRVFTTRDGVTRTVNHGEFHLAMWPEDEPGLVHRSEGVIRPQGEGRVLLGDEMLRLIGEGRRMIGTVARPPTFGHALAVTEPEPMS